MGLKEGDTIAIDMPMTLEAVAIYLAGIKAGIPVVTIADSFTPTEIAIRLKITKPKVIFTQDVILKSWKKLAFIRKSFTSKCAKNSHNLNAEKEAISLRKGDFYLPIF